MRRVDLTQLGLVKDTAVAAALKEIMLASAEVDLTDIANGFKVSGSFTETRVLNVTSPTLANAVAFLATFIADCQRGGATRTT